MQEYVIAVADVPARNLRRPVTNLSFEPITDNPAGFIVVMLADSSDMVEKARRALARAYTSVIDLGSNGAAHAFEVTIQSEAPIAQIFARLREHAPAGTTIKNILVSEAGTFARLVSRESDWVNDPGFAGELVTSRRYAPAWERVDFVGTRLTSPERETARIAMARGYYRTPRACTMEDLAREIGISKSAVYHRLAGLERKSVQAMVRQRFDAASPQGPALANHVQQS